MADKTTTCELCERKSGIYHMDCLGCVVREALEHPKPARLGFMMKAAEVGQHGLETIKQAVIAENDKRKQQ